jgi:hypothetical protein
MKKYFAPHMRCALTSTITTDELLANAGTAGAPKDPAPVGPVKNQGIPVLEARTTSSSNNSRRYPVMKKSFAIVLMIVAFAVTSLAFSWVRNQQVGTYTRPMFLERPAKGNSSPKNMQARGRPDL